MRSTCKLCMAEVIDTAAMRQDVIFEFKVPPEVKNLIWRVARNCIPSLARSRAV